METLVSWLEVVSQRSEASKGCLLRAMMTERAEETKQDILKRRLKEHGAITSH